MKSKCSDAYISHMEFTDEEFMYLCKSKPAHTWNTQIHLPAGSSVKNLPAVLESRVQFLGHKDPLEKGTATHSSILASRIPWTEEPGGLQSTGSQRVRHD